MNGRSTSERKDEKWLKGYILYIEKELINKEFVAEIKVVIESVDFDRAVLLQERT